MDTRDDEARAGGQSMLKDLKRMARYHGHQARQCSARMTLLLRCYRARPQQNTWMCIEALGLSRRMAFHLRHSKTLSHIIVALSARQSRHLPAGQLR